MIASRPLVALLGLAFAPALAAAPVPADTAARQPMITLYVQPVDRILADVRTGAKMIARLAPAEKEAKEFTEGIDPGLEKAFGLDWKKGIDTTRPLGGYGTLDENLPASTGVLMVPVREEADALNVLRHLLAAGGKPAPDLTPDAEGLYTFKLPDTDQTAYFRFAHRYAYLTLAHPEAVARKNLLPPDTALRPGGDKVLASARLHIDRVPQRLKDLALGQLGELKKMMRGEPQPQPGPQAVMGLSASLFMMTPVAAFFPWGESAIRDGQELVWDIIVEPTTLQLNYDLTLTPRPGSQLADNIAAVRPPTTLFAGLLGNDTAAQARITATLPEDAYKPFLPKIEEGLKQMANEVPDPSLKKPAGKLIDALLPTVRAGSFDMAVGLRGPQTGEQYALVAGVKLQEVAGVESALRELAEGLPAPVKGLVKLDARTVAGVKVHEITIPKGALPPQFGQLFGDGPVYLAFRKDAAFAALGAGALTALEEGLTAAPTATNLVRMDGSARKLMPMVRIIDADAGKKFEKFIGTEVDRVALYDLTVTGGPALRVRYDSSGIMGISLIAYMWLSAAMAPPPPRPIAQPAQPAPPPPPPPPAKPPKPPRR